jgi:hypothetical protein
MPNLPAISLPIVAGVIATCRTPGGASWNVYGFGLYNKPAGCGTSGCISYRNPTLDQKKSLSLVCDSVQCGKLVSPFCKDMFPVFPCYILFRSYQTTESNIRNCRKLEYLRLSASSLLPVRRLPLKGFLGNLIFKDFLKNLKRNFKIY